MNDRIRFRAGFKVSYYDKDGNDKELLIEIKNCFSIINGGDAIIINEDIIKDFIKNLSIAEQNSVWEYMQANFDETNDYWFIDKLKYLDQCIGLKDKNGRLIYNGDILGNEDFMSGVALLKYEDEKCRYILERQSVDDHFNKWWADRLMVIGNIHENKELLTNGN